MIVLFSYLRNDNAKATTSSTEDVTHPIRFAYRLYFISKTQFVESLINFNINDTYCASTDYGMAKGIYELRKLWMGVVTSGRRQDD